MPSAKVSEKVLAHMKRLAALPQVQAQQFQPGPRLSARTRQPIPCWTCKEIVEKTPFAMRRHQRHFCSKLCADTGKISPVKDKIVALYEEGKKMKEICAILGKPMGTVAGLIHRYSLAKRWGNGVSSKAKRDHVRTNLPKFCELCGYDRAVEVAHIVPACQGGKFDFTNVISLCPNCHFLFDNSRLSDQEQRRLQEVINSRI